MASLVDDPIQMVPLSSYANLRLVHAPRVTHTAMTVLGLFVVESHRPIVEARGGAGGVSSTVS